MEQERALAAGEGMFPVDVGQLPVVDTFVPDATDAGLGHNTRAAFGMQPVDERRLAEARILRAIQPFAQMQLSLDTNLRDAGMGSLDQMCAVQSVQDEFNIEFKDIRTVRDIVNLFRVEPQPEAA